MQFVHKLDMYLLHIMHKFIIMINELVIRR